MSEQGKSSFMDEALFNSLYEAYATDVLRVSYYYLGNRAQAEDVTQDVFLKLFKTNPALEQGREKAWLLKVALNRCRDLWRGAWVKRVVLGSAALELTPSGDELEERVEKQELMQAINKLPPAFKEAILLFYYQNLGISEIAKLLDLPEGTISSRLSRGRKKLEEILKGSDAQ